MFSFRARLIVAIVGLEAAGVAGFMMSGCSGDTVVTDGGPDGTADVAKPDVIVADVNVPDVQADVADAGTDAISPAQAFAMQEGQVFCEQFLNCCPGGLDGGTYDLSLCAGSQANWGWEGTLPVNPSVYGRGHIAYNADAGAACLAAIKTFPCVTQAANQWGPITTACEGVIQGTIPANTGGCVDSFECAPNNYCDPTVDGGLCTPIAAQGQPCNTKITDRPDEMCSYLGSTQSGEFCDLINNAADAATCQPVMNNGSNCVNGTTTYYSDQACKTLLCGDNLKCGGTASYPYADFCTLYTIKDAGGGG